MRKLVQVGPSPCPSELPALRERVQDTEGVHNTDAASLCIVSLGCLDTTPASKLLHQLVVKQPLCGGTDQTQVEIPS